MKKVIIIMILGAGLFCLFGCRSGKHEKDMSISIRWVADPNPIRKEQIAIFERDNPLIKVEIDSVSGMQKVLTNIAGGVAPDAFMVYSLGDFITLVQKGVLADLTPFCEKYNVDINDFWPQIMPWIKQDNRVYGFPEVTTPFVLFYNKTLFMEMGISSPDRTWTWDTFRSAAIRLTKKDNKGRTIQFGTITELNNIVSYDKKILMWSNGGMMFSADEKECIINRQEPLEAIRFIHELRAKYRVVPTEGEAQSLASTGGAWGDINILSFGMGRVAMMFGGRFRTITLRKMKDVDWDIAHMPKGRCRASLLGVHTNCVARDSKHKEEAFRFLNSLVNKDSQLLVSDYGEAIPSRISIAGQKEVLYSPAYPGETSNHIYLEVMRYSRLDQISPYYSPIEVDKIWKEEFDKLDINAQNPQETLDNIARKINKQYR